MKPRNVSVSAVSYQQETYVTITFKLPICIGRDEDGITERSERHRIQKEIQSVIESVEMSGVKDTYQYWEDKAPVIMVDGKLTLKKTVELKHTHFGEVFVENCPDCKGIK